MGFLKQKFILTIFNTELTSAHEHTVRRTDEHGFTNSTHHSDSIGIYFDRSIPPFHVHTYIILNFFIDISTNNPIYKILKFYWFEIYFFNHKNILLSVKKLIKQTTRCHKMGRQEESSSV